MKNVLIFFLSFKNNPRLSFSYGVGLRKKKAAPAPPPPRPLSSAISTQALERIIDSEESLPAETEASPSRKDAEANIERRSVERRSLNDKSEKLVTSNEVVPVPEASEFPEKLTSAPNLEPAFERKRGKLVRSKSSLEQNRSAYSFVSRQSLESVVEVAGELGDNNYCSLGNTRGPESRRVLFARSSAAAVSENAFYKPEVRIVRQRRTADPFDEKSGQFFPEITGLKGTDLESLPPCGILESRFSPKRSHSGNYICDEKCQMRMLKQSLSFQSTRKLKETKIESDDFYRGGLKSSHSFNAKSRFERMNSGEVPKLGDFSLTSSLNEPRISSRENLEQGELHFQNSPTPYPLSNLQIFAISAKLENIQAIPKFVKPSAVEVPDIRVDDETEDLPSLPTPVARSSFRKNNSRETELVSIFKPPPPGLVSRQESNENWNNFLSRLNSILESRVGEFV